MSDRRTVRVAADLVPQARRVASLLGQSSEAYTSLAFSRCAERIEAEIAKHGPFGVRDLRAKVLTGAVACSTFIVPAELAERFASMAGQCLTSVAKLIDPHLRPMLANDYRAALVAAVRDLGDAECPVCNGAAAAKKHAV